MSTQSVCINKISMEKITKDDQQRKTRVYSGIALPLTCCNLKPLRIEMPEESAESCRCCINPSSNFVKLTTKSNFDGAEEKSYHELLQEITRRIITSGEEMMMPQNICRKCVKQLKNVYSFIQQTQNTYDYYRGRVVQEDEDTKVFEQLHDTLFEIPETKSTLHEDLQLEVKEDCSKPSVGTIKTDLFFINTLEGLDDDVKVEFHETLIEIPETKSNLDDDVKNEFHETVIEVPETKSNLDDNFQLKVKVDFSKTAVGTKNRDILINTPEDEDLGDDVKVEFHETLIEIPETKSNLDEDFQLGIKEEFSKPAVGTKNTGIFFINTHEDLDVDVKEEFQDEIPINENNLEGFLDEGDSDSWRCDVCQKVYKDERLLAIHKRFSHMPEDEKMSCPLCSYKASRLSTLKVHMRLIHDERGYKRPKDLRKHKHIYKTTQLDKQKRKENPPKQKEEPRFLCAFCGQSYKRKSYMKSHQLTHTGELPYECDICHKGFKGSKELRAHRVVHSDEKPFQCSQCSKSFKRSDKLKTHMVVHSDIRPYKCTECEKSFKYQCVLRKHMYKHTGQPAYSCDTCGEEFALRKSLNDHCLKSGHVQ